MPSRCLVRRAASLTSAAIKWSATPPPPPRRSCRQPTHRTLPLSSNRTAAASRRSPVFCSASRASFPLAAAAPRPLPPPFAVYFFLLIIFHMAEYLLTAAFRPDTLSFDNFLLNHSTAYQACVLMAWTEYWLEFSFFSSMGRGWGALNSLGLLICLVGLVSRSLGMATASTNFSHKIEERKRDEHRLVTHGIYAHLRHPAYFGFFWWSVGTQILLCNPICVIGYAGATWHFFYDRIPHEEALLIQFFGEQYRSYMKDTVIGIPFIEYAVSDGRRRESVAAVFCCFCDC